MHLSQESPMTKKGVLLLYYSDLSQILGIQETKAIEKLCAQHKLILKETTSIPFIEQQKNSEVDHDPLVNFKNQAKIHLHVITRA